MSNQFMILRIVHSVLCLHSENVSTDQMMTYEEFQFTLLDWYHCMRLIYYYILYKSTY